MSNNFKAVLATLVLNNAPWKVFSLVIAILIYFYIRAEISHIDDFTVPIDTKLDKQGELAIESIEPRAVQIFVRGSLADVSKLSAAKMRYEIPAKKMMGKGKGDKMQVKFDKRDVVGVRGVHVIKFEPSTVLVKFDKEASVVLQLEEAATIGKARGVVSFEPSLKTATLKGSKNLLDGIDSERVKIKMAPINVEGRTESFDTTVSLRPPDGMETAIVEPSEIPVKVRIKSELVSTRIERVPVIVLDGMGRIQQWVVEPAAISVEVSGPSEVLKELKRSDITAIATLNEAAGASSTNLLSVSIHVKQDIVLSSLEPLPRSVAIVEAEIEETRRGQDK